MKSDNAKVMKSKIIKKMLRKGRTQQMLTEPKYQNQNRAERMLKVEKNLICRLISQHHCPPKHLCCALEITCDVINHALREGKTNE